MAWHQSRLDRLRQIVAILIKRNMTPRHNLYGTVVQGIVCGEFGMTETVAREYTRTLGMAWKHNRWISYVRHNPYLDKKEIDGWIEEHSRKPSSERQDATFSRASGESA